MSYQPQTEAATSRFLNVDEGPHAAHPSMTVATGKTVVMLHGSGRGHRLGHFSRNIDPLVEAGYRVLLLDCPGGAKRCYRQQRLAFGSQRPHSEKRGRSAGIDKVHLLGNSMGGHSAVAFTLSWPERWLAGADGRGPAA